MYALQKIFIKYENSSVAELVADYVSGVASISVPCCKCAVITRGFLSFMFSISRFHFTHTGEKIALGFLFSVPCPLHILHSYCSLTILYIRIFILSGQDTLPCE